LKNNHTPVQCIYIYFKHFSFNLLIYIIFRHCCFVTASVFDLIPKDDLRKMEAVKEAARMASASSQHQPVRETTPALTSNSAANFSASSSQSARDFIAKMAASRFQSAGTLEEVTPPQQLHEQSSSSDKQPAQQPGGMSM
jgi:hypothetical protein